MIGDFLVSLQRARTRYGAEVMKRKAPNKFVPYGKRWLDLAQGSHMTLTSLWVGARVPPTFNWSIRRRLVSPWKSTWRGQSLETYLTCARCVLVHLLRSDSQRDCDLDWELWTVVAVSNSCANPAVVDRTLFFFDEKKWSRENAVVPHCSSSFSKFSAFRSATLRPPTPKEKTVVPPVGFRATCIHRGRPISSPPGPSSFFCSLGVQTSPLGFHDIISLLIPFGHCPRCKCISFGYARRACISGSSVLRKRQSAYGRCVSPLLIFVDAETNFRIAGWTHRQMK